MANSVGPDETVRYISSGSTLFAQVLVLVYRAEQVKFSVVVNAKTDSCKTLVVFK